MDVPFELRDLKLESETYFNGKRNAFGCLRHSVLGGNYF